MNNASRRKFMQQTGTLASGALVMGLASSATATAPQSSASSGASPLSKPQKLRALLRRPGLLHAPEAYTVIAGKLAEAHGFEAAYIGGNMMSGTYLGAPDWGVITSSDIVDIAGRITSEISIPAIVDADQGGETALNVHRTVQQYERAGIAALHIEDLLNPKMHPEERERFFPDDPIGLQTVDRMVVRIQTALDARSDPDFVIIARTLEVEIDKIIARGQAYAKAGADLFMNNFRGMTGGQIDQIASEVPIPLVGIGVPLPNRGTRLKVNVYANLVSAPAMALCDSLLKELKEKGEVTSRPTLASDVTRRVRDEAVFGPLAQKWVATP